MSKSFQFSRGEEPKTEIEPNNEEEGLFGCFTHSFDNVLNSIVPAETRVFLNLQ